MTTSVVPASHTGFVFISGYPLSTLLGNTPTVKSAGNTVTKFGAYLHSGSTPSYYLYYAYARFGFAGYNVTGYPYKARIGMRIDLDFGYVAHPPPDYLE